jgi:small-conductance mechanosensitive channel
MNFAIAEKFREVRIEMPFPQRDLHVRSGVLKVENVTETEAAKRRESADVFSDWRSLE